METEMKFTNSSGVVIENLAQYIKDYFQKKKDSDSMGKYYEFHLYVGTDALPAKRGSVIKYVTAITLYTKGMGGHVIYSKNNVNGKCEMERKLENETNYSIKTALYLTDNEVQKSVTVFEVHLDVNSDPTHKSYSMYKQLKGWAEGCGFIVKCKPDAPSATHIADHIVREKKKKNKRVHYK